MVAPLLLGILGAGLASQAGVSGVRQRHKRVQGQRLGGILDDLPEDASVDDQRRALAMAGLLSPESFADIGFEDQASERDFFEAMELDRRQQSAAMSRQNASDTAAMDRLRYQTQLGRAEDMLATAQTLATQGAFGIGQEPVASDPQARDPYSVGSNLDIARQAVASVESSGNYRARGPVVESGQYAGERALGAYQVMPSNLRAWAPEVFGRQVSEEEFMQSEELQNQLFDAKFGPMMQQHGFADAMSRWHSGRPLVQATREAATDGYTPTLNHVANAVNAFQGVATQQQAVADRFTPELRQRTAMTANAIRVGTDLLDYASGTGPGRALTGC